MYDVKSLFQSTTFWAALVAVLAGVAGLFGYVISDVDQQSIVQLVSGSLSLLGGAGAIWGRIVAKKTIG